jgi:CubicO group peptidase (beta-lactamase class C family)
MNIEKVWDNWNDAGLFSGVFSVSNEKGIIFERCCGFRNRSEELLNNENTAFGIASGTKLFTGLAVCKLIDAGKLSLYDKLWDLLPYNLGQVDKRVTVHHLLTHTSGIGDYIDEEAPDSIAQMQALYN